ncbi:MAG TPA: S41 family peptidase [Geminicoccaceae bacterium]
MAALLCLPFHANAGDGFERLEALIARHAPAGAVPDLEAVRGACAGELRCAAETIAAAWPEGARLLAVPEADPQLIRAGVVPRSVTLAHRVSPGVLRIRIDRFGRRASGQVLGALAALRPGDRLEIDLRTHRGGSIARMLEVAGIFTGARPGAVRIVGRRGVIVFAIPAPPRRATIGPLDVLIGPDTRSSAEVLAALLHRYAGARLLGERTFGKNWAEQPLKVDAGWYLMVRAGEIRIDGERLEGGLLPDAPPPGS